MAAGGSDFLSVRLRDIQALPLVLLVKEDILTKDIRTLTADKLTDLGRACATTSNFSVVTADPSKLRASDVEFFGTSHGRTFRGTSSSILFYWAYPAPEKVNILAAVRFESKHAKTFSDASLRFQRVPSAW
jgi:hypothetical protein